VALSGNILIAGTNYTDQGTLTAGSEASGLPVGNLQDRRLSAAWSTTTTDPADTWFQAAWDSPRLISLISLIGHNLTQGSKWRARLSTGAAPGEPGAAIVYDTGWIDTWPTVVPFGVLPWGVFQWGGVLSTEEAAQYTIAVHHPMPAAVLAEYLRVDLDDAGNPDGYLELGRPYVAAAWQPGANMSWDWSIHIQDDSETERSRGGQLYATRIEQYRVASLSLDWLTDDEVMGQVMELDRIAGVTGDVLVIPRPDKTQWLHKEALYCRIVRSEPNRNPHLGIWTRHYEFEELL
jgi:hypothetical protein